MKNDQTESKIMPDEKCYQIQNTVNNMERRQDRMEDVVDRLTNISADLSKMIAVHEQRLNQQERQLTLFENLTERRREEYDEKLAIVFKKIDDLRKDNNSQYEQLSEKIVDMEKQMWRLGGAFAVLAFILAYGPSIIKVLNIQ
jgi:arginine utilization protein RocB